MPLKGYKIKAFARSLWRLGRKRYVSALAEVSSQLHTFYNKQEELITFLPNCSLNSHLIAWKDRSIGFIVMCFYLNGYPIYPHLCLIGHFHFEVTEHFFHFFNAKHWPVEKTIRFPETSHFGAQVDVSKTWTNQIQWWIYLLLKNQ